MSRSGVVELEPFPCCARCGLEELKAMLQVSRWLNLVEASGQLTVAPLQTYYRS